MKPKFKLKVFKDEISETRYIPFEIKVQGETYTGTLVEMYNPVGGIETFAEYEIDWDTHGPADIDEETIKDEILKQVED